jgi:predicted nuclease of predicted toxin-antitoxin system
MPEAPSALYLDEDVSVVVAAILRAWGFAVVTARDAGHLGASDAEQLAFGAQAGRVLLTHNRVDFERLHREWLESGRPHAGIIIARRRSPREIAARVGRLLSRLPPDSRESQLLYV